MKRVKYSKPQGQSLDKMLAFSIGGCAPGGSPGSCGLPGFGAGTCAPTGNSQGVAPQCPATGSFALGGCSTGNYAMAPIHGGTE